MPIQLNWQINKIIDYISVELSGVQELHSPPTATINRYRLAGDRDKQIVKKVAYSPPHQGRI